MRARGELFKPGATISQWKAKQRFTVSSGEKIEDDEDGRVSGGELLHTTGRGMKSQLQLVKRKCAAHGNGQFPIENELLCLQLAERSNDVRKIASQRLTGF